MLAGCLQASQVDDVDNPDAQLGQCLPHDLHSGQGFQRGHFTAAGHDHVRIAIGIAIGIAVGIAVGIAIVLASADALPVQCQAPKPAAQCATAASIDSHCGVGCLPAATTLTQCRLRRPWSITDSRQWASGGS